MKPLDVQKIAPGLWRWTAPHPDWRPEKDIPGGWAQMVGSVYHETPEAVVLIDPLEPPENTPERASFWAALDLDVERLGRPVAVLLANHYHVRSAAAVYERYRRKPGATVWAHEAMRDREICPATHVFQGGQALPGGISTFTITGLNLDEVVFYLPAHRALVPADALLGAGNGELRVAPASWADASEEAQARYRDRFRPELRRLLDLPVERVLVSHGEPVLEQGRRALAKALDAPAWGQ